jgi:hypothetical protein
MLNIFMSAKEHLPCVELCEDAGHGPDVTLHVPLLAVEDHLGGAVLTRVHYLRVVLVLVGGASEVNQFDFHRFGTVPETLFFGRWF